MCRRRTDFSACLVSACSRVGEREREKEQWRRGRDPLSQTASDSVRNPKCSHISVLPDDAGAHRGAAPPGTDVSNPRFAKIRGRFAERGIRAATGLRHAVVDSGPSAERADNRGRTRARVKVAESAMACGWA